MYWNTLGWADSASAVVNSMGPSDPSDVYVSGSDALSSSSLRSSWDFCVIVVQLLFETLDSGWISVATETTDGLDILRGLLLCCGVRCL